MAEAHTRTLIVSATAPGFMGSTICDALRDVMGLTLLFQAFEPLPTVHLN